jgi:hypothetical protein
VDAFIGSLNTAETAELRLTFELLLAGVTEATTGGVVLDVGTNTTSTQ